MYVLIMCFSNDVRLSDEACGLCLWVAVRAGKGHVYDWRKTR